MTSYPSDSDYFRLRAEQEALAAAKATCPRARDAHSMIARRYFELGRELAIYDSEPQGITDFAGVRQSPESFRPARREPIEIYVRSLNLRHDKDSPSSFE